MERPAEGAQAGEADIEANIRHTAIGRPQEEHRPLDAASLQVTVRRFAECRAEGATEVRLGNFRNPREVQDVEWLSEGAVHRVSSAEHPAIALFYSAQRGHILSGDAGIRHPKVIDDTNNRRHR
jgi:hypothetical protein